MINLANYEAYALDFLEGNLTEVQTAAMHAFLAKNPTIRAELNNFSLAPLTADENMVFAGKNNLHQPETAAPKVVALPSYSSYYRAAAVAATAIFMFGASIYLYKNNFEQKENNSIANLINPDTVQSIIHSKNAKQTNDDAAPALISPENTKILAQNTGNETENKGKEIAENTEKNTEKNTFLKKNKKNIQSPVTLSNLAAINNQTKAKNTQQNIQGADFENKAQKENEKNIAVAVTFPNTETINKQAIANIEKTPVNVIAELQAINTIQDFYFETDESTAILADNTPYIDIIKTASPERKSFKKNIFTALAPETSFDRSETKIWESFVPSTRSKSDDRTTAFLNSLQPETLR